jgi:hypothetical protein
MRSLRYNGFANWFSIWFGVWPAIWTAIWPVIWFVIWLAFWSVVWWFALVAAPAMAQSQTVDATKSAHRISGQVFANSYFATANPSPNQHAILQLEEAAWLTGDLDLNSTFSVHGTLTATELNFSPNGTEGVSGTAREAYLEMNAPSLSNLDCKIGRQIISWGKSDGYNPTDYFSAFDDTIFNPDREIQRLGPDSLLLSYTPNGGSSNFGVLLVLVADAPRSKIVVTSDQQTGQFVTLSGPAPVPFSSQDSEAGTKLTYAGRDWDGSVSFYVGHDHTPEFQFVSFSLPPTPSLTATQIYQAVSAIGSDFSWSIGTWVMHGEAAFTHTVGSDPTNDPSILPDRFDAVLGFERPLLTGLRLGGQVIYRLIPNWQDPNSATGTETAPTLALQKIAEANQLIEGTQHRQEVGATLRFDFTPEKSKFDLQLFLIGFASRSDYFLRPMVTYHWRDELKTYAGFNFANGPPDSPFGAFDVYNAINLGAIYIF